MCSPGALLSLGGSIISGIGAAKGAEAQASQMYAEAGRTIAQGASTALDLANEAALHDRQGKLLRIQGSYDAARTTEKGKQLTAAQVGGFASNGFAIGGSIAEMVKTTAESAGLDIATLRYGANAGLRNEEILGTVYRDRSLRTLKLAASEASDMVVGAKSVKDSELFAFVSPIINAGGTVLKSGAFA